MSEGRNERTMRERVPRKGRKRFAVVCTNCGQQYHVDRSNNPTCDRCGANLYVVERVSSDEID